MSNEWSRPSVLPVLIVAAMLLSAAGGVRVEETARAQGAAAATGTIEGRIVYETDVARPWRFARYYVRDSRTGHLAEAVVALGGRSLSSENPAPATHGMDQELFQFVPETLAIRAGDSVKFTNSDTTTHNVKADSPLATFNISMDADGDYTHTFRRAGGLRQPVTLGCIYHGGMRAWIYVFEHPFFQMTGADGRFRLEGVPAGEHTLEVVHPAGGLHERRKVTVPAGRTVTVDIRLSPDDKRR